MLKSSISAIYYTFISTIVGVSVVSTFMIPSLRQFDYRPKNDSELNQNIRKVGVEIILLDNSFSGKSSDSPASWQKLLATLIYLEVAYTAGFALICIPEFISMIIKTQLKSKKSTTVGELEKIGLEYPAFVKNDPRGGVPLEDNIKK